MDGRKDRFRYGPGGPGGVPTNVIRGPIEGISALGGDMEFAQPEHDYDAYLSRDITSTIYASSGRGVVERIYVDPQQKSSVLLKKDISLFDKQRIADEIITLVLLFEIERKDHANERHTKSRFNVDHSVIFGWPAPDLDFETNWLEDRALWGVGEVLSFHEVPFQVCVFRDFPSRAPVRASRVVEVPNIKVKQRAKIQEIPLHRMARPQDSSKNPISKSRIDLQKFYETKRNYTIERIVYLGFINNMLNAFGLSACEIHADKRGSWIKHVKASTTARLTKRQFDNNLESIDQMLVDSLNHDSKTTGSGVYFSDSPVTGAPTLRPAISPDAREFLNGEEKLVWQLGRYVFVKFRDEDSGTSIVRTITLSEEEEQYFIQHPSLNNDPRLLLEFIARSRSGSRKSPQ